MFEELQTKRIPRVQSTSSDGGFGSDDFIRQAAAQEQRAALRQLCFAEEQHAVEAQRIAEAGLQAAA